MESSLRNEHLSNWDETKSNGNKPIFDENNYDSPISERTSMASTTDDYPSPPVKPYEQPIPTKQPNNLRYYYNELPANGVPLATQYQLQKKEQKKNMRKAPPGQGALVPLPDDTSTTYENYYPYTRYYQTKNAKKITQTQKKVDKPTVVDHDDIDVTPYLPDRSSVDTPTDTSRRSKKKKSKKTSRRPRRDRTFAHSTNDPKYSSSSSTHFIPLKDADDGYDDDSSGTKSQSRHRHHHRHHHHHHHHHRHQHSALPPVPTSKAKTPIYDPYVPQLMYENSEFNVIDDSYKRSERSPFILGSRQAYRLPPPAVYNQTAYLPPISSHPTYFSPLYYNRDWKENRPEPQVYKPDTQTRFYDRYLNNVIEKRLTAL